MSLCLAVPFQTKKKSSRGRTVSLQTNLPTSKIQSSTWPIRLQVTLPSTSRKASTVPVNFRSLISQVITDKQVKHVWQALQKKLFLCLLDAFQDRPQVLQLLITSFTRWHSAIGLIKRTKFQLPIAWKDIQLLPKKKIINKLYASGKCHHGHPWTIVHHLTPMPSSHPIFGASQRVSDPSQPKKTARSIAGLLNPMGIFMNFCQCDVLISNLNSFPWHESTWNLKTELLLGSTYSTGVFASQEWLSSHGTWERPVIKCSRSTPGEMYGMWWIPIPLRIHGLAHGSYIWLIFMVNLNVGKYTIHGFIIHHSSKSMIWPEDSI